MNKFGQFVKKITPKKLIGIQFIYLSFVIAIAYVIGNQVPIVIDTGETGFNIGKLNFDGMKNEVNDVNIMEYVFNQPLFEEIILYFLLLDGIFIGFWFLKRD